MSDDSKSQILEAIDAEISAINERHRLEGLTSWAIAAAAILLLSHTAALWEAGGLRWRNVATLVMAILLVSDVISTLLVDNSTPRIADPPFRLWMYPYIAAITLQIALFATAYYLRHDVPAWASVLAMITFGGGAVMFAVLHPALANKLSQTTAVQHTWDRRSQRPHDAGVRAVLFLGRRLRPTVYAVLAFTYGQAAYSLRQGESLRDLRLAMTTALIVTLLGLALRERVAPMLAELRDLRRSVALDRMSPSDATDAFLATIVGIKGAPYVTAKCREAILAMRALRLEAENTLQATGSDGTRNEVALLHQQILTLDSKVRQVWSITKAQQSMYEVLHPRGAQLLANIIEELEAQIETLTLCSRAVENAINAGGSRARASDA